MNLRLAYEDIENTSNDFKKSKTQKFSCNQ